MNTKGLTVLVLILIAGICSAEVMVENLRCEYLENPLGIDVVQPRLSWITESKQRGWLQSEYQILVASSQEKLKRDEGDLWDSGKVQSDRSIHIEYAGKPLTSRTRCYWKVRAWDKDGTASNWSEPALWTMGLLKPEDWQGAQWIGLEKPKIVKKQDEYFLFELPEGKTHTIDRVVMHNFGGSDNSYYSKAFSVQVSKSADPKAFKKVNSGTLKAEPGPQTFKFVPVTARYVKLVIHSGYRKDGVVELGEFEAYAPEGKNVVAAKAGATISAFSSQHAKSGDWSAERINDGVMTGGSGSWCSSSDEHTRLPARYLRRDFKLNKPVKSATAYVCGLGEFDLFMNGREVTDRERDPGIMMYDKRLLYVTFDVTDYLKQENNTIGAILGNGRYFAPRQKKPTRSKHFGDPRLLTLMHIQYLDGTTQEIVSDANWTITDNGPIRTNNEFDGEEYDARMEMPGWSATGFNDSAWQTAQLVTSPGGKLESFMYEPMRICETIKPVAITNPDPGVYIVDMGQGFYGTVRLKVSGPAGTKVQMRSGYSLFKDGRFNVKNQRSAKTTDIYILKGQGRELWYPRFRGQGYRYVEVTGFPGVPTTDNFEGLFIHCNVEETGSFECSNPLINKFNSMMHYDQLGQKRGATLDPDRDERQGWLGGSFVYVEDESAHANVAAHYTKWLEDIRLDQRDDGAISDVSPALWSTYTDDMVWPADLILVPLALHKYYGDRRVLDENYEAMKKWLKYAERSLKDDFTIDRNTYGDWCDAYLKSVTGSTSKPLISTAFYSFLNSKMAEIATLLGKDEDATHFADVAKKVKKAFNKRFFDPESNSYASKTQCAYVLALAMDLVPEDRRQAVIDNLIHDIMVTHDQHVSVGLVGMFYYMRTLTGICDRADVAYAIANQKTRPSWGYMVSKDAAGMWERWEQDTQGPGMNGQGFLMLTGDLNAWIYQGLAGINPNPQQPGFKHIVLKPQPVGDLTYVNCSYKSMYGRIVSNWKIEDGSFKYNITIPANTTATVYVPAKDAGSVTESGKPAGQSEHVRFIRMQNGRAVFEAGSGNYEFGSTIAALLTLPSACVGAKPTGTAITNVTVIDAVNGVRENQTVLFDGDKILAVQAASVPASVAESVDGSGRYLIPGLWDFHVHLTYNKRFTDGMPALFLSYGITSVRDTGGLMEEMLPVVERLRADDAVGPRVFFAGPLLDGNFVVYDGKSIPHIGVRNATPDDARTMIRNLHAQGVDFIKIYEMVSPEVFSAMVETANELGLPIAAHVPLSMRARTAGPLVDSLEHLRNIEMDCASNSVELLETRLGRLENAKNLSGSALRASLHELQRGLAMSKYDEATCDETLQALQSTIQVPTLRLVAMSTTSLFARDDWQDALARLPADVAKSWKAVTAKSLARRTSIRPPNGYAKWVLFMTGRAHGKGVPIAAGTDTPINFSVPGYSLHSELEMLVRAGLSPLEALKAATVRPAEFFSLQDELGTIDVGKRADMVLLDANPLDDIANTKSIVAVISKGQLLTAARLRELVKTTHPQKTHPGVNQTDLSNETEMEKGLKRQ